MQEIKRHGTKKFDLVFIVMNPGYEDKNIKLIKENAKKLGIPIEVYDSDIFQVSTKLNSEHPCYMCARMRICFLYNKAQELGCNKIALGHHFNDVIETTLLSMFYGSEIKTMMPKLHSDNFKGIELIRPLFYVHEDDIISWKKYNNLEFLNCACKFTEKSEINEDASKRRVMKRLIKELKSDNKNVDNNIFKALDNVNLNCVLGYKKENVYTSFLDDYDEREK
jgi:tRNA(Ile)-lysidine synthase TilS/MesJ